MRLETILAEIDKLVSVRDVQPVRRVVPGCHGELVDTGAERLPAISKPAFSMPAA
ncbi:hypothetical protein ACWFQ8_28030 [Streptomyces sp. NPDC055254]